MATEKLKFKIQLYSTWWKDLPKATILISGKEYFSQTEIDGTKENPTLIEFEAEMEEDKEYTLTIIREGKDGYQTIVNEKGDILKDQLLHIASIEIDEIDLGNMVHKGTYTPQYQEPWRSQQEANGVVLDKHWQNCDTMGHNGKWELSFTSPFYMWLLENLY